MRKNKVESITTAEAVNAPETTPETVTTEAPEAVTETAPEKTEATEKKARAIPAVSLFGKSAPVGKTLAEHLFKVLRIADDDSLKPVAMVTVFTNFGDNGKDNRETAEKVIGKEYKDRSYIIRHVSTTAKRYEMSVETFVTFSDPKTGKKAPEKTEATETATADSTTEAPEA